MPITDEQFQERVQETRVLIDEIEDVIDGENIGVIISSLLYLLAEMYDGEVMTLDKFIEEVNKSLRGFISRRDAHQGETQWLQ